jgi:hypothetical protein
VQSNLRALRRGACSAEHAACRRSTAALRGANQRPRSASGALPGTWLKNGCCPFPPVPVQRLGRRPVVVPAGRFPKAARERSVWLRPRAPHSLRFREYPRPKASFTERDSPAICNGNGDECQGGHVNRDAASRPAFGYNKAGFDSRPGDESNCRAKTELTSLTLRRYGFVLCSKSRLKIS